MYFSGLYPGKSQLEKTKIQANEVPGEGEFGKSVSCHTLK